MSILLTGNSHFKFATLLLTRNYSQSNRPQHDIVPQNHTPDEGLEPATLRLKVWCSTDWANRALGKVVIKGFSQHSFGKILASEVPWFYVIAKR